MLDTSLFNYNDQSLLIYIDSEHTSLYILQTLIKTFTQVSRFFQMKPLISYYQNLKDYHVLALSADSFTLLVGNRYGLKKVSHIENISLEVMFENQERKNFVTRGSYGGSDSKGVFHGHGDTKKLKDIMKLKYFNEVDSLVLSFQKEYGVLPVILLMSIVHMNDFMTITKNDSIIKESIDGNLFEMTLDEVASNIQRIDHKAFEALIHMKIKQYHNLLDVKQSSDNNIEIKKALGISRVETLLISSEHILGSFDEYINIAISKGSEVLLLNNNEIPKDIVVAAIFRYRL